jgi:AcrR family transcriptional regulator
MEEPKRRRHGAVLESAILAAAWDELAEIGYARLTMGSIAARARTSEPVLYRRWPDKHHLVGAAIEHQRRTHPVTTPDTGALRTDLLAQLHTLAETLSDFYVVAAGALFSGLTADTGVTLAQGRRGVLDAQDVPRVRTIYVRAHERGELDLDRIPAAVLDMPFDLIRQDMLMNLEPPGVQRISSIVDELFLPLVEQYQT